MILCTVAMMFFVYVTLNYFFGHIESSLNTEKKLISRIYDSLLGISIKIKGDKNERKRVK